MILSNNNEFQCAYNLHKINPLLEFNKDKGADFIAGDTRIKLEEKSKLNRTYLGGSSPQIIGLTEKLSPVTGTNLSLIPSGPYHQVVPLKQSWY